MSRLLLWAIVAIGVAAWLPTSVTRRGARSSVQRHAQSELIDDFGHKVPEGAELQRLKTIESATGSFAEQLAKAKAAKGAPLPAAATMSSPSPAVAEPAAPAPAATTGGVSAGMSKEERRALIQEASAKAAERMRAQGIAYDGPPVPVSAVAAPTPTPAPAPAPASPATTSFEAGSSGTLYNPDWLRAVSPFYNPDTGTELMGPLIYTLARSTRPKTVVELGSGYTTFFLAQGLKDAAVEAKSELSAGPDASWTLWGSHLGREIVRNEGEMGNYRGTGVMQRRAEAPYEPTMHSVDYFGTGEGTHYADASAFESTAAELGLDSILKLHVTDWDTYEEQLPDDSPPIDLLWFDGFDAATFWKFWPRVAADGGMCVLHSTLNNHANYRFLSELKLQQATRSFGEFELISLLEPHKWQQNSCTLIRKISAYDPNEVCLAIFLLNFACPVFCRV